MQPPVTIEYLKNPIGLTLVKKWQEFEDVYSFKFLPNRRVPFQAGQNVRIVIPGLPEGEDRRSMSVASIPSDEYLLFSMHTKSGSPFKTALLDLKEGEQISLIKIKGKTVLPDDTTKPVVFIAGGVGVTPFRSLMCEVHTKTLPTEVTLIHVSSTEHLYQKELERLPFEQHRICRDEVDGTVTKAVKENASAQFYLAGSPPFTRHIDTLLQSIGVDESGILFSRFTGYEEELD